MKSRRGEKFAWIIFAAIPVIVLAALFAPLMIDGSLAEALSPRAAAAPVDPDIKLCPPGHKDYVIVTITGLNRHA